MATYIVESSSRIAGRIEGQIISEGKLIIEEEAVITAQIQTDEAIVQGTVHGKLEASERVELAANSVFEGDIITPSLIINEGALFNGQASMTHKDENIKTIANPESQHVKNNDPSIQVTKNDSELSAVQ